MDLTNVQFTLVKEGSSEGGSRTTPDIPAVAFNEAFVSRTVSVHNFFFFVDSITVCIARLYTLYRCSLAECRTCYNHFFV